MADVGLTEGKLLGGAVRYFQPESGYRTGIEPIFLAAAVPARAGERVLEAGTGAAAGLLCLAHRVPGIRGVGIDIEPAMARIAAANIAANGQRDVAIAAGDILRAPIAPDAFDHAMANPPWHDTAGSPPPDALKRRAKLAPPGQLTGWIAAMAQAVRRRGTLTLILPPRLAPRCLAAFDAAGCGAARLFPLWPKPGREPRIVLLQAVKGGRTEFRLLPGLVLHERAAYSAAAEAILRHGGPLPLR